jgi:hypothetical protein
MRKELDEALCAKYPEIFKDRHGDVRETAMCWGFECGDGWYNIIDNLCATIQNREYNNKRNNIQIAPVVATQVKEKYGTLRFYYSGGDDYIDGVVAMAEYLSGVTCETCGAPGKTRDGGWVRTLCDEHAKEQGYE